MSAFKLSRSGILGGVALCVYFWGKCKLAISSISCELGLDRPTVSAEPSIPRLIMVSVIDIDDLPLGISNFEVFAIVDGPYTFGFGAPISHRCLIMVSVIDIDRFTFGYFQFRSLRLVDGPYTFTFGFGGHPLLLAEPPWWGLPRSLPLPHHGLRH